jgi:Bacterial transglutaminase-like N-terminal region
MPILTVRHVTTYHYKQPVAFGEHRMMLRPRDDDDQIRRGARLGIKTLCAWRSCASRVKQSRCRARGLGPNRSISP